MKKSASILFYILIFIELNAQNVGIGTSTPISKLTVQTPLNTSGWTHIGGTNQIVVDEAIGGVSASIGTNTNHPFRIKANNTGLLHVYPTGEVVVGSNTTGTFGRLTVETLNNSYGISHIGENGNILATRMGGTSAGIGTFSATDMRIFSGGLSRIYINQSTGEVSIGTDNTSAGNKLNVQTLSNSYGITHTDGNVQLSTFIGGSTGGGWIGTKSNHPLSFFTNSSTAQMTINTNGSVGIGTSVPAATAGLHINHDLEALRLSGNQSFISFYNGSNYKGYLWNKGTDDMEFGTSGVNTSGNLFLSIRGTPYLKLQGNGQVSVAGDPAPFLTPEFSVRGNGKIALANSSIEWTIGPNIFDLYVYSSGFLRAMVESNSGDWIPLSDKRLKENIQQYKPVIEGIKKLEVLTYHYKSDKTGKRSFGLIAQNVQEYFPEIVSAGGADNLLGIAYSKTGVLAIKAIQEQQVLIEQQQQKIDLLEKRLETIEKILKQ